MKYSLSSSEFKNVYKNAKSLIVRDLLFKYAKDDNPKLGFIVSTKYGNAVERNLFKRRCRHAFYQLIKQNFTYSLIITPNNTNITWDTINEAFDILYNKVIN